MIVYFKKILLNIFNECFMMIKYMHFIDQREHHSCLHGALFSKTGKKPKVSVHDITVSLLSQNLNS